MAQVKLSLRALPQVKEDTGAVVFRIHPKVEVFDKQFQPVFAAAQAVLNSETDRSASEKATWRDLADAFYEHVLVDHYVLDTRSIKIDLQMYIEQVTGTKVVVSKQDKLKLAPVCRFFFGVHKGNEVSRQDINRLATLGWAAKRLGVKPSVAVDDAENYDDANDAGNINTFLTNIRAKYGTEIDPDSEEKAKARKEKRALTMVDSAIESMIDNPTAKLAELIDRLPDIAGTTFDPEADKIILGFAAGNPAGKALMAQGLAINDDEEHLIKVRRRADGNFDVLWVDVGQEPSPALQREMDAESELEGEAEGGQVDDTGE